MRAETRAAEARLDELRAAQPPEKVIHVGKATGALERIRAILDRPPQAFDTQKIQAEIAGVLGPYTYKPWPRLKT